MKSPEVFWQILLKVYPSTPQREVERIGKTIKLAVRMGYSLSGRERILWGRLQTRIQSKRRGEVLK